MQEWSGSIKNDRMTEMVGRATAWGSSCVRTPDFATDVKHFGLSLQGRPCPTEKSLELDSQRILSKERNELLALILP